MKKMGKMVLFLYVHFFNELGNKRRFFDIFSCFEKLYTGNEFLYKNSIQEMSSCIGLYTGNEFLYYKYL